ncbi:hypothetical protein Mapa_003791 [Marchantia paleacea]|nr:hypothetical protein Mapa_003791 [Marchantia paleacea]
MAVTRMFIWWIIDTNIRSRSRKMCDKLKNGTNLSCAMSSQKKWTDMLEQAIFC